MRAPASVVRNPWHTAAITAAEPSPYHRSRGNEAELPAVSLPNGDRPDFGLGKTGPPGNFATRPMDELARYPGLILRSSLT